MNSGRHVARTIVGGAVAAARSIVPLLFGSLMIAAIISHLAAQEPALPPTIVRVDEVDQLTCSLLERSSAQIAAGQWDEAIEALNQAKENAGDKLFKIEGHRYVPVREICWQRLAALPSEALAKYRQRIDPIARRWYSEGVASHNAELLEKVVEQAFVSSYGDDALLALGEIALEQADYNRARWCWERISPQLRTNEGQPLWLTLKKYIGIAKSNTTRPTKPTPPPKANTASAMSTLWTAYPDTDLDLAAVRARLILVSILEGSLPRARIELELFSRLHADAKGRLAGKEVKYVEALESLLDEQSGSMPVDSSHETAWPTFGGAASRDRVAPHELGELGRGWSTLLSGGEKFQASSEARLIQLPDRRPAEDVAALLSYHSVVADGLVFANNLDEIYAFQLASGEPAWPGDSRRPGRIFYGGSEADDAGATKNAADDRPNARHAVSQIRALGVPRFTMTVQGRWLLARMGWPVTGRSTDETLPSNSGYLACLDLQSQGKLKWKITADEHRDPRWAFEGSPLSDGTNVYIAMRFSDIQPQSHVACFDLRTGALRWRKMVCAADTIAHGAGTEEITHNLLTLDRGTLYVNTNLGAVAAIDSADGRILWLATYPRSQRSGAMLHAFRDLNPAVLHLGTVLVAPSDFEGILGLDACNGQLLWTTGEFLDGAIHLLGTSGNHLWASGNLLWRIDVDNGKVVGQFPASPETTLRGYGRGVLSGNRVYWPARNEPVTDVAEAQRPGFPQAPRTETTNRHTEIRVFDASNGKEVGLPIRLDQSTPSCDGGNLIVADNHLIVATPDHLMAYPFQVDATKSNETHPENSH